MVAEILDTLQRAAVEKFIRFRLALRKIERLRPGVMRVEQQTFGKAAIHLQRQSMVSRPAIGKCTAQVGEERIGKTCFQLADRSPSVIAKEGYQRTVGRLQRI